MHSRISTQVHALHLKSDAVSFGVLGGVCVFFATIVALYVGAAVLVLVG
jgi:hypothetical protein